MNNTSNHTVDDIYRILAKHNALIVHFSGTPKGAGNGINNFFYPDDLKNVIDGNAQGGLSCSTITPADNFHGFDRNATGSIGVIIGLRNIESLVCGSENDCGSGTDENGDRYCSSNLVSPAIPECLESAITNRQIGRYNELVVKNYDVLGILAVSPYEYIGQFEVPVHDDCPYQNERFTTSILDSNLYEISNIFNTSKIYTFSNNKICILNQNSTSIIEHKSLYKIK